MILLFYIFLKALCWFTKSQNGLLRIWMVPDKRLAIPREAAAWQGRQKTGSMRMCELPRGEH